MKQLYVKALYDGTPQNPTGVVFERDPNAEDNEQLGDAVRRAAYSLLGAGAGGVARMQEYALVTGSPINHAIAQVMAEQWARGRGQP